MAKRRRLGVIEPIPAEELVELYLSMSERERKRDFSDVKEIALLLDKDGSTVRKMLDRGDLDGFKNFGRRLVYKPTLAKRLKEIAEGLLRKKRH